MAISFQPRNMWTQGSKTAPHFRVVLPTGEHRSKMTSTSLAFTPIAQVYIGRKPLFLMTESNPEQIRQIPSWISSAALHQTLLGESWGPPWDAQSGQRDLPSSHLSDPKTKKPEEKAWILVLSLSLSPSERGIYVSIQMEACQSTGNKQKWWKYFYGY